MKRRGIGRRLLYLRITKIIKNIYVYFSLQMTVMVSASFTEASRDIQHVPIKLRKCRFYDESTYLPFYTYSDCMLKCRMFFLLKHCNCTPFNMPKIPAERTCNMEDVPCLRTYYCKFITHYFIIILTFACVFVRHLVALMIIVVFMPRYPFSTP